MIKIIAAFFTAYQASGSRLLLQTAGPEPQTPPQAQPAVPSPPVIVPINIPAIPVSIPGQGALPTVLECNLGCTQPGVAGECASPCAEMNGHFQSKNGVGNEVDPLTGQAKPNPILQVPNIPDQGYTVNLGAAGAAAFSKIHINSGGKNVKNIGGINVNYFSALFQSTVIFENIGQVEEINCGPGLCNGATFVFINSGFGAMKGDEYIGCGLDCEVCYGPLDDPNTQCVTCDSVNSA